MNEAYESPETSLTLLRKLGERNEFAWEEFAKRYATFLRHWCEHWGVSSNATGFSSLVGAINGSVSNPSRS
jgi:hypothetical protein